MSRKKKNGSLIPWRGAALSIVIQFLLTALLAVLIGRGLLPISEAKLWEGAISLIAGTSAAMSCREGEGRARALLIAGLVPAILIMLAGWVICVRKEISFGVPVSAICTLAPCLAALAIGKKGRRTTGVGSKYRRRRVGSR